MYKDISISQRIERIGELLAKGVYLYLKEGKDTKEKDEENIKDNKAIAADHGRK